VKYRTGDWWSMFVDSLISALGIKCSYVRSAQKIDCKIDHVESTHSVLKTAPQCICTATSAQTRRGIPPVHKKERRSTIDFFVYFCIAIKDDHAPTIPTNTITIFNYTAYLHLISDLLHNNLPVRDKKTTVEVCLSTSWLWCVACYYLLRVRRRAGQDIKLQRNGLVCDALWCVNMDDFMRKIDGEKWTEVMCVQMGWVSTHVVGEEEDKDEYRVWVV
jgi:hypothetical protein